MLVTDPELKQRIRVAAEKEEQSFYHGRAPKRWLTDLKPFGTDWRNKYVFDFQLPEPEDIFNKRQKRTDKGTHPVDEDVSLEQVRLQVAVYTELALYFHRQGLKVLVRNSFQGEPRYPVDT